MEPVYLYHVLRKASKMSKPNSKLSTRTTDRQTTVKSLYLGGIVVLLIAISPLLFYSYKNFPEVTVWKTSYFTWETTYYSWFDYAWYLSSKIVPLYLLLIWFFTCRHWWHWILLVPIAMYTFQLWGVIKQNTSVDELEFIYLVPLMMIIIPVVYLIRAKLFNKIRGNDLQSFEEELMQKKSTWQQIKDLFQ